ncbi:MAG TPA: TonB-dependent receptor [Edaphocola sp.]|nr:TonB-dependent receptor [Edaphocola sp.]
MKKRLLPIALGFLLLSQGAFAQSRPIKGQVLDDKGEPVVGAAIQIKGTHQGTVTDADGNFSLEVPDDDNTLVIRSVGFTTQEVQAGDGLQPLVIHFSHTTTTLNETVIVGYGTETKKTIVGASSTISGKEMENIPMGSFTNILQGKASGVQVTAQNGAPGSPAFVRVRGTGSLSAGQGPLYVIDGTPVSSDAYSSLNPNDIESISVLKDASTASIYGSRGSNGVVMITTKKGTKGKSQIKYNFQYGIKEKTPDNYDMMDFDQKLKYERDLGYTNQYLQPLLDKDGISSIDAISESEAQKYWNMLRPYETNWFDEILRKGHFVQHDLSFSGGSDKTTYFLSFQSYREDGISLGSDFDRKSGSLNFEHQVNKWVKIGENAHVAYSKENVLRDRFNVQNPFAAIYMYNPYESPYDFSANGLNGFNLTSQGYNIVEAIQTNPEWKGTLYGLSSTYVELAPVKGLTLRSQLGTQFANYSRETFMSPNSILDVFVNGGGVGSKTDNGYNDFTFSWTNTAQYEKIFNDVNRIKVLIGTEFTKDKYKSYSLTSQGYAFADLNTQENAATPISTSTSRLGWTMMSYFARAEYGYKDKYMASFSVRNDGSSRFGTNEQYGMFYAGGLAWILTEEDFLKGNPYVNFLKLWASVGTVGNDAINDYIHMDQYQLGTYNGGNVIFPSEPGNEELTWEKNTNYSIGVDFYLFNNKLTGSLDYFNKYTYSLLLEKPISPTTGFLSQISNVGAISNHGMELTLNYDIINTEDWHWSVGGNLTLVKNEVKKLNSGEDLIWDNASALNYYKVGYPADFYYLQKSAGVDPNNGDELWYKEDGTTTNDYNEAGLFYLDKSPNPTYFGGVYTNVSFKGIGLGINVYYSGGNYIYNNQWLVAHDASSIYQNMAVDAADYWTPTNKNAPNPKPDINKPTYDSDRWLQKGDFIRLRDITLSYNLPSKLINKAKMQAVQVYLQAHNLWYWAPDYKGDPEIGIGSSESGYTTPGGISLYSYPTARAFTFGLSVTF